MARSRKVLLGEAEFEAMEGLTHLAIIVYIKGIRPFMDYSTGITGIRRGISYQSLSEEAYVEPEKGRHISRSGPPSKDALRNAIKSLIKSGLVTIIKAEKKLIFKLNHALMDNSDQNMNPRGAPQRNTTGTPQANTPSNQGLQQNEQPMSTRPEPPMSTTPPVSGKAITTTTTVKTSKTYIPKTEQNDSGGGGVFDNLIFNKNLGTRSVQAISKLLPKDNPEIAQALLDELSGMMNQQDIKSPTGYFRGIVNRYNAGDFEPTAGVAIAERRQSNAQQQREFKERHKEMTKPVEERVVDKEKLAANRAAMKAALKIKKVTA